MPCTERCRKEIFPIGVLFQADRRALPQRTIEDVAQVEEPGERGGAPGSRGGMALKLHPAFIVLPVICSSCARSVHQGDNRTTASTTTLRTTVAIAATSMLEIRLDAMTHFLDSRVAAL